MGLVRAASLIRLLTAIVLAASAVPPSAAPAAANRAGTPAATATLGAAFRGLSYSTFLGGSSHDFPRAIAAGPDGSTYVAGQAASDDLATTPGVVQPAFGGDDGARCGAPCKDAFLARYSATGRLLWLTYLGGSGNDAAYDVDVDDAGYAYVTGYTMSIDFPLKDPLQSEWNGGQAYGDAFVTKLSPDGGSLVYSTYLGGHSGMGDAGFGIAVDSAGRATVAGHTDSRDFPTTPGALKETCVRQANYACSADGFVVRLASDGSKLEWSTLFGAEPSDTSDGLDEIESVAVASDGSVVIAGFTRATNFPATAGAFDTTFNLWAEGFVARIAGDGSAVRWATYLGGEYIDDLEDLVLDDQDRPMVVGRTLSIDFPTTPDARDPYCNGWVDIPCHPYGDGFFTILAADGSHLAYSTFLGGAQYETLTAIARDADGDVWITGGTGSVDFETMDPVQDSYAGLGCFWAPCYDAFVRELVAGTWQIGYSTYLGGYDEDYGNAIAVVGDGVAFAGYTGSEAFPVTNAADDTCGPSDLADCGPNYWGETSGDAFVARLDPVIDVDTPIATAPTYAFVAGSIITSGKPAIRLRWNGTDATSGIASYRVAMSTDGGSYVTVATALTTPSLTLPVAAGHTYRFRVRATDRAGNVGAWATSPPNAIRAYQQTSSRITYSGTWRTIDSMAYWGGSLARASATGAQAAFTFTGRSFAWVTSTGPTWGSARIYVNGTLVGTVDLSARAPASRRLVFLRRWATTATRTVVIRAVGTAGHPRVGIDGLLTGT